MILIDEGGEIQVNSQTFLLCISEECLETLKGVVFQVRFLIRNARVKVLHFTKLDDDLSEVNAANKLSEDQRSEWRLTIS